MVLLSFVNYSPPFTFGVAAFFLFFAMWGSKMAWESRNVPEVFNESKQIGVAVYFVLLFSFIVLPLDLILSDWGSTYTQGDHATNGNAEQPSTVRFTNKQESIQAAFLHAITNNKNEFSDWKLDELDHSIATLNSNVSDALSMLRGENGIFAGDFRIIESNNVPDAQSVALLRGICILIVVFVEVVALFAPRFYTDLVKKEGKNIVLSKLKTPGMKSKSKTRPITIRVGPNRSQTHTTKRNSAQILP